VKQTTFSNWLRESLWTIGKAPAVWLGYTLFVGAIMPLGRISLALGIFASVSALFVGVGINKYIDLRYRNDNPVGLIWAINKSLPLAILAAACIVICWFFFNLVANLISGQYDNIGRFFFFWEYTPENLKRKTVREIAVWLFTYANVALIFVLLMLSTFASWFSYPLMLFKNISFSQAKEQGQYQVFRHQNAYYKLLGFVFLQTLLCTSVIPLMTPVLYMLVSTLMYVSYQDIFVIKADG
jgi:hypothetical protein